MLIYFFIKKNSEYYVKLNVLIHILTWILFGQKCSNKSDSAYLRLLSNEFKYLLYKKHIILTIYKMMNYINNRKKY